MRVDDAAGNQARMENGLTDQFQITMAASDFDCISKLDELKYSENIAT